MTAKSQRKRRRKGQLWVLLLLIVVAAGGGYYAYTYYLTPAEVEEEPALQTAKVRRGDIVITALGSGNLVPEHEVDVGFRSSGTLVELNVAVGDRVREGDVLARLDDAPARLQVTQAELNLAQAREKLAEARAAYTQTLEVAQANLRAAEADYEALLKQEEHTNDRLTTARINLEQARRALEEAQTAYDTAWDPGRDWELYIDRRATALENERESTRRALEKARDDLQIAIANYNLALLSVEDDSALQAAQAKVVAARQAVEDAQSGAAIRAAEWAVKQAELALESAQLSLENTVLRAPCDGTVVAVTAAVGEAVGTAPVVTLADLEKPRVRFYLEESDLDKVATGNRVTVIFDAYPDREFTGHVVQIAPVLSTVDGTPAVQAWAVLDEVEDDVLLPAGLTADVEVVAGEAYKTLLIPVQALRELAPGKYAVFVLSESGQLELRPVEVGLRDFANAQILSGLELGEVVSTGTVETGE